MISKKDKVSSSFVVFALNVLYLSQFSPIKWEQILKNIELLAREHDAVIDADAIRRGEGGGDRQDGRNAICSETVRRP